MEELQKTELLGVGFSKGDQEEILEYLFSRIIKSKEKTFVVTPNPELVMMARDDSEYRRVLNHAQVSLPDGVGVVWGLKFLGKGSFKRISGVDFMQKLCQESAKRRISVGFVGGRGNVAEKTSDCLQKSYENLKVEYAGADESEFLASGKHVDILFIAFGSPKQEKWIAEHLDALPVKAVMGVGGAFDMVSGRVRRAPVWMRRAGLEWLWRLFRQPWRAKRQTALVRFVIEVLKEKVKK